MTDKEFYCPLCRAVLFNWIPGSWWVIQGWLHRCQGGHGEVIIRHARDSEWGDVDAQLEFVMDVPPIPEWGEDA